MNWSLATLRKNVLSAFFQDQMPLCHWPDAQKAPWASLPSFSLASDRLSVEHGFFLWAFESLPGPEFPSTVVASRAVLVSVGFCEGCEKGSSAAPVLTWCVPNPSALLMTLSRSAADSVLTQTCVCKK